MQHDNGLEVKVGLFVVVGLTVIAVMIMFFGRFGERLAHTITVTVEFPSASGLLSGASVNLSGAPIGRVEREPVPREDGRGVSVVLRVKESAHLREDARFRIAEVGMLGDHNVEVDPTGRTDTPLLKNGDIVVGAQTPGFAALTDAAQPILQRIDQITAKINGEVLTPETTDDIRQSIKRLRSILTRTDALLAEAESGHGALGRCLKDPKMASDLAAFIANLRHSGILFYSDASHEEPEHARR